MKQLVCTLCTLTMGNYTLKTDIATTNIDNEILNRSRHDLYLGKNDRQQNPEKEYVKSCQVR